RHLIITNLDPVHGAPQEPIRQPQPTQGKEHREGNGGRFAGGMVAPGEGGHEKCGGPDRKGTHRPDDLAPPHVVQAVADVVPLTGRLGFSHARIVECAGRPPQQSLVSRWRWARIASPAISTRTTITMATNAQRTAASKVAGAGSPIALVRPKAPV